MINIYNTFGKYISVENFEKETKKDDNIYRIIFKIDPYTY